MFVTGLENPYFFAISCHLSKDTHRWPSTFLSGKKHFKSPFHLLFKAHCKKLNIWEESMATPNLFCANLVDGPLVKNFETGKSRFSRIYLPDFFSKPLKECTSSSRSIFSLPHKTNLSRVPLHQSVEKTNPLWTQSVPSGFLSENSSSRYPGKNQGEYSVLSVK